MITRRCAINAVASWLQWTQPVLKANGTLGGSSFACAGSTVASTTYDPWNAFANNSTHFRTQTSVNGYILWYNPNPLKIYSIAVSNGTINSSMCVPKDVVISGSDDNINWTALASYTNTSKASSYVWTIPVDSTVGYKYHKLQWSTYISSLTTTVVIQEIDITATYQA